MGYNTNIVGSPVVVFAGAGASAHLGYPTGPKVLKKLLTNVPRRKCGKAHPCLWGAVSGEVETFEHIFDRLDGLLAADPTASAADAGARKLKTACQQSLMRMFGQRPTTPDGKRIATPA